MHLFQEVKRTTYLIGITFNHFLSTDAKDALVGVGMVNVDPQTGYAALEKGELRYMLNLFCITLPSWTE